MSDLQGRFCEEFAVGGADFFEEGEAGEGAFGGEGERWGDAVFPFPNGAGADVEEGGDFGLVEAEFFAGGFEGVGEVGGRGCFGHGRVWHFVRENQMKVRG